MRRTFAAAIFALLAITVPPAYAYTFGIEDFNLNLTYPGSLNLTGNLNIQLSAPSVPAYLPQQSSMLSVNGTLLSPLITGGPGYIYYPYDAITYFTLSLADLNYGDPLLLSPSDIQLNGLTALSGTVVCTANCAGAVSPTPLPAALPLLGSALLALAGFAAYRSRRAARG
jgi:hypothetical protein